MTPRSDDDELSAAKQLAVARFQMTRKCELLEIPAPFPLPNSRVLLLEPAGSYGPELSKQLLDGPYDKPFILDCGALRFLPFDLDKVPSLLGCADPAALCPRY